MAKDKKILRVMTFNLRHGRGKRGLSSLRLSKRAASSNLDRIGKMFKEEKPGIVMLQEADRKSVVSGRFNHVDYLAEAAGYRYAFAGEHVHAPGFSYGTAILSKYQIQSASSYQLETNMPILQKGFVLGTLLLPQFDNLAVDVVSTHLAWLDFMPRRTREKQAGRMVDELQARKKQNPLIIGGDFNCDYRSGEQTLEFIAKELNLNLPVEAFPQHAYPTTRLRRCIDWIMVSPEFVIDRCRYVPVKLSDHHPIVANLKLK
jgi:endonuclease/exonuclease/phosphatase family metal-dependent hydrolase